MAPVKVICFIVFGDDQGRFCCWYYCGIVKKSRKI